MCKGLLAFRFGCGSNAALPAKRLGSVAAICDGVCDPQDKLCTGGFCNVQEPILATWVTFSQVPNATAQELQSLSDNSKRWDPSIDVRGSRLGRVWWAL